MNAPNPMDEQAPEATPEAPANPIAEKIAAVQSALDDLSAAVAGEEQGEPTTEGEAGMENPMANIGPQKTNMAGYNKA